VSDSIPPKKPFADRLKDIEPFRVVEVLTRAKQLEHEGRDIVHLEAGEPDFDTASPIVEAGQAALARGDTHYTQAAGIPALREAISSHYKLDYGLDIGPERIMVTSGASGALLLIAGLLINPGDSMLMADPGYPCNRHFLRLVEGRGQLIPVGPEDRYQLTARIAEKNWEQSAMGIMVASPANPTGEILSKQELTDLYQLCERKGGHLVVDEIYHGLTYGDDAPSILEITDQAFVMNSFSKYFGMTGWRLGWLVAPEPAVAEMEKLAQNIFISTSTMAQHAALAAFEPATRKILDKRRDEFAERRDYLLPELRRLGFDIPNVPVGALYLYAGIKKFSNDSQKFCMDMLEKHGIAITPGLDFGHHKNNEYVRFAYTTSMERLKEAVRRMDAVLGN